MGDDDDEFGDLYADALRPARGPPPPSLDISSAFTPSTSSEPPSPPILRFESGGDDGRAGMLFMSTGSGSSPSSLPSQLPARSVASDSHEGGDKDWILGRGPVLEEEPQDRDDGEDDGLLRVSGAKPKDLLSQGGESRVLMEEDKEKIAGTTETQRRDVGVVTLDIDNGIAGLDQEPVIRGLSLASIPPGALQGTENGDAKVSRGDDWDSDSECDFQIVLNNDNLAQDRNAGVGVEHDDGEDGEDDLVIVTDEDQRHHHHHRQETEERDWVDESVQQPVDGEKKEKLKVAKGSGDIGAVAPATVEYRSHGYHGQHQSQFKYIQPGAAAAIQGGAADAVAASGQVCTALAMGPIAGRGRGAQRNFRSGYGLLVWSSGTSAHAYGNGLEFTLPLHKTIFDIDIDDLKEKPWRIPGVDISDFFNFGLNEDNWRAFCKQLAHLRLEATMQGKIRVYERGHSELDYDPDLPPELAAAAGPQDTSAGSRQRGKADGGEADLMGQGRGTLYSRSQLPIGRTIHVESSFRERLPSIDTRQPRMCDSDAIIEIVLQETVDICSDMLGPKLYQSQGQDVEGDHEDKDDDKCSGRKREAMERKGSPMGSVDNNAPEGNHIVPCLPDMPSKYLPNSKSWTPAIADDLDDAPHAARWKQSNASAESSNDAIAIINMNLRICDDLKDRARDSMEEKAAVCQILPIVSPETTEVNFEQRIDEQNDKLALDDGAEVEKEESAPDLHPSDEWHGENGSYHAFNKQKLSSQVEQFAVQDKDDGDDSRATHSDSSGAKSGSGKDHLERDDGGEEVGMQAGRTRHGDVKGQHHEEEHSCKRRYDYRRDPTHDINRSPITSKGKENMRESHLQREWDSTNYGCKSEGFERGKERYGPIGGCLRKENAAHGRRGEDEGRKRDHEDEIGLRRRSKARLSGRKEKDVDLHSRKHIGDGDWKGHHDRYGEPRPRNGEDILMSRHENLHGLQVKRRKDEVRPRRENVAKKDAPHGCKGKESTAHSKRERDNGANNKSKEDKMSARDRFEDHVSKHWDDNPRHRGREDGRLSKQNEDSNMHKKREKEQAKVKGGRVLEDKLMSGIERFNNLSKGLGSDEYQSKDRRQHSVQRKRGDHIEEHTHGQHKTWQRVGKHESQLTNKEKNLKNERFSNHSNHSLAASDSQQLCRERHRKNSRRNKESKGGKPSYLATGKRKRDDLTCDLNEKVGAKTNNEQEGSNVSADLLLKKGHHITGKPSDVLERRHFPVNHSEENAASKEDDVQNVRRGRSKLERWTSHEQRDYNNSTLKLLPLSSGVGESEIGSVDILLPEDPIKAVGNKNVDSDPKGVVVRQINQTGVDRDYHLDTVAKLKKQSEQFKLPLQWEQDTTMTKKLEEVMMIQGVTDADKEINQERPACKRK